MSVLSGTGIWYLSRHGQRVAMSLHRRDGEGRITGIRPSVRGMISATRVLRRAYREQNLDEENPAKVLLRGEANSILERAREFAGEDREDREAVRELL
jgi:hypothetical protein